MGPRPKAEYTKQLLGWEAEHSQTQTVILEQYIAFYCTIYTSLNGEYVFPHVMIGIIGVWVRLKIITLGVA